MAALTPLPEIERLSVRVIRILGGNPGKFTLQGTNTYLVGQGPKRILIDTGEGKPAWLEAFERVLSSEDATVEHAVLTHWHPDHVGGLSQLLKACPDAEVYKNQPSKGQSDLRPGQIFKTGGATLRAFHCPGHTADHMAFVLEEEDAMFTGDNVLGYGTSVFEDLSTYLDSLRRMSQQFEGRAYPAHGDVVNDGKAKVLEYISHREARESQILEVLRSQVSGSAGHMSSMDIVKIIYSDVPESLHVPAEGGVLQVLRKLVNEGKVEHNSSSGTWRVTRDAAAL